MTTDPELAALIEQAARNLATLELLTVRMHPAAGEVAELRQRIRALREAYTRETNDLTREVLRRAIDRRRGHDRRKPVMDAEEDRRVESG